MSPFTTLAEPNRRQILDRLADSPASVNELVVDLGLPQPTVSKHLRVLRDAKFVSVTPDGQKRVYRINPEPFQEVDEWLKGYRKYWSEKIDALERHLIERDRRKS